MKHANLPLHDDGRPALAPRQPLPFQERAIRQVVSKFAHNERGRLIMARGTGKTFTALRIAEEILPPPPPYFRPRVLQGIPFRGTARQSL